METGTIEAKVRSVFAETLCNDEWLTMPGNSTLEQAGVESLEQMEVIIALEVAFGLELPDTEALENVTSVEGAGAFVCQKLGERGARAVSEAA